MPESQSGGHYSWAPSERVYRASLVGFGILFRTLWPLSIQGRENVPRSGPAVIVCNHLSMIDPFVVGYAAGRLVSFMAKEELFKVPVVGGYIRKVGAFPVDRSKRDASSLRTALEVLHRGELLGMFPEGTRSRSGEMLELRTGAARLAARTRSPIVPAAVINTDHAIPPGKLLRPARIGVCFGPPFELTELYDRNDKGEAMDRAVALMRERIEALHSSVHLE